MRSWGPGLLENEVGAEVREDWLSIPAGPGEHPLQPYLDSSRRWMDTWRSSDDGGDPHAWMALVVLQASIEFLADDLALEVLSILDAQRITAAKPVSAEYREAHSRRIADLRDLLQKQLAGEGTEEDLERIAALGDSSSTG